MAQQNYSVEDTERLVTLYKELGNDGIPKIAEELGKTINSVRSKLVKEGVYTVPDKMSTRKNGPSKKEILRDFEELGLSDAALNGLQGATKPALKEIRDFIRSIKDGE